MKESVAKSFVSKPLTMKGCPLTQNSYFEPLQQSAARFEESHLTQLFLKYPNRFHQLSFRLEELLVDFSKQRLDSSIVAQLQDLAIAAGLPEAIQTLFSETKINQSEGRAAMHWALRTPEQKLLTMGINQTIARGIHQALEKMYALVEKIHQGQYRGATGEVITDVVNIGVGGSDLGPLMASYALSDFKVATEKPLRIHFVSTMDGSQLSELLHRLRPETTLFIISSKSFGTIDTLKNAETVRHWLDRHLGLSEAVLHNHFIGVSTNVPAMTKWGIAPDRQLLLWDWVGGRYSLWSCIGLPIALTIGVTEFKNFLAGAHLIDEHFQQAALAENLPALLALIGIWNSNFLDIQTHAVLPYDGRLKYFASYLQQLEMESNGKDITRESSRVDYTTCPIIWGEVGPNAQHAFYQLLHQGTQAVSADFIAPIHRYSDAQFTYSESAEALLEQHDLALANCFAQSRLLAFGNDALQEDATELPLYKQYQGNQPSTTLLIERLTPKTLGMLIALYEHKVFVQSVIWEINPFDQWGVEKGKEIANQLIPMIKGNQESLNMVDSSTRGLIQSLTTARNNQ
ncbi:glucose-6-phosphate isomerase [Ignatzschineria ureiclastica]|nr:glucose-6-phosphate isomerase [Ignatzschineria ureiclastica]GHA01266.1 glucose-6-phosphate isomerase [Ignatzschineria ureiclastica]